MNLPNKISISRILLIPLFLIFFFLPESLTADASFNYLRLIGVIIFVVASITDFVDGKIARKRNLVTNLGKFLDTTADKVLITAGILCIVVQTTILPAWAGAIAATVIIGRDLMIMGLRSIAAANNIVIAADKWGKYKHAIINLAIVMYMALACCASSVGGTDAFFGIKIASHVVLGIGIALSIISAINYMWKNKVALKEDKPKGIAATVTEAQEPREKEKQA